MLDPIFNFFDKLIDQFSWRRLAFLTMLIAAISIGLWGFEGYTQSYKLARLEKQITLLEKLAIINSNTEIKSDKDLQAISLSIKKQLKETDFIISANFELPQWSKKALATALIWFAIGLSILLVPNKYTRTRPEIASVLMGMTAISSPFIALSIAMPTNPWINYAIYPIGHLFILGFLMLWIGLLANKNRNKNSTAPY